MPVIGGLIIGFMAKYGSDKIKGHGIPEAMEAVLTSRSRIEAKVAILKPLSAAIAIGTGGPFGAEGPIIQTGGALGSLVGQIISTTAAERKVLLACGAGAGMAATFNTPIAGVILAIELLLFEFRARSFIPLVIASTLATSVRALAAGAALDVHNGQREFRRSARAAVLFAAGRDLRRRGHRLHEAAVLGGRSVRAPARSTISGIRRSARWDWASSDFLCRACWASATTRFPTF